MAKLRLAPDEVVIHRTAAAYLRSRFRLVPGEALVTQRRFLHVGNLRATAAAGLVGALAGGRVDIDVPLRAVAALGRARHGRGLAWTLATVGGEEYRLLGDLDGWRPAFDTALAGAGCRLVERQAGTWAVEPA
ncbi:MAG TPA: hypothetical protein VKB57_08380 [Acidimicrobiales bacterium]|nr:hypothetical protein [Acidimicrobiales bacterium]